ncbi:hypothetical protein Purlil1_14170 [Purpureocillium lilacinum]|uniref:Secreted protein n=1 Tax=Purpureocillium lilacinum TaxID=33203 RepID=A0ABR0BC18_PURLI|nr:hypothetical protein Purlil1_14170 [Purpureocillium lilacinum]
MTWVSSYSWLVVFVARRIRGGQNGDCEAIRLIGLDEETRTVRGGLVTLKAMAIPAPVFLSSLKPDSLNANFFMAFRPRTNANRERRVRHHPFLPRSGTTGRTVASRTPNPRGTMSWVRNALTTASTLETPVRVRPIVVQGLSLMSCDPSFGAFTWL